MFSLSIIYVNYHCEDLICHSIESLFSTNNSHPIEIIIIDNGSSKSDDFWSDKPVTLVRNPDNMGFGRACNIGAQIAHGDFLIFLNPDTVPNTDIVFQLVSYLQENPAVSACGPKLTDQNSRPQIYWNFHHLLAWELAESMYLQGIWRVFYENRMNRIYGQTNAWPVPFVSGACIAVRKAIFEKIRGFDPRFFMNFEDYEICQRLQNYGPIHYLPWLQMIHEEGSTQRTDWGRFIFSRIEAHRTYINIAYHGTRWLLARLILIAATSVRLAIGVFLFRGASRTRLNGYIKALGLVCDFPQLKGIQPGP